MLLANIAVSHKLATSFPEEALLRCHPPPKDKGLTDLTESLQKYGINLAFSSAKDLNESFEAIADPVQRDLLRLLAIKKMKRAEYYCTGSQDISMYPHYALAIPLYTHFTYDNLI
jgi:exoribonuclease R